MDVYRILFTGIGRRIELVQAFREASLVLNKKIIIYGADMSGNAPALAYCDYDREVVEMNNPEYIDDLLRICKEDKINLLIPTIDTDLLILSKNKRRFEEVGTKVLISDPDKILICRDKSITSQFFVDCGLCAPIPVNCWRDYKAGYPAFIKPKDGSSSINAHKVENQKELELYASQIEDYVVQPYITGNEYTIDVFCDWDGEPISIVPRERVRVRAGEVLTTKIFMDQTMIEEAKKLCDLFKPCGPITVQLIRDDNDVDWYIEINPRFGGGAPLSMKAGARSAETILQLLAGEPIQICNNISDKSIYSRFDQSVCIEAGKGSVKGVIFDLDDTLYSEKEYVRSGFKAVCDYLGGDYENDLWAYYESGVYPIDALLARIGRMDEKEKVLSIYRNHMPNIQLYSGVKDMLRKIKKEGKRIGIITDGRPEGQRNKITALGLWDLVDDVIITDELGGIQFRKPCDIAFRIVITRWKLNRADVVYVGDNISKDFLAPQQLGMRCIWFRNSDGLYFDKKTHSHLEQVRMIQEVINYVI